MATAGLSSQRGRGRPRHTLSAQGTIQARGVSRRLLLTVVKSLNMFSRKIRVEYEEHGLRHPCPMKWMDSFSMRNFTNASVFDDTLPVGDGLIEAGARVPIDALREAMEDWFRRKSYLPTDAKLLVTEL